MRILYGKGSKVLNDFAPFAIFKQDFYQYFVLESIVLTNICVFKYIVLKTLFRFI